MPTHQLSGGIHWGIQQNIQGQDEGTSQDPVPIHHYSHSTGHPVSPECFIKVDRAVEGVTRKKKEVMYILVNDPSLNRNLGKY